MPTAAKIASSSVGGSRRTRRVPYFVFQSSLIGASHLIAEIPRCPYVALQYEFRMAIQPCIYNFSSLVASYSSMVWPPRRLQRRRNRARRGPKCASGGAIGPLLEKHQPQRVFAIDMTAWEMQRARARTTTCSGSSRTSSKLSRAVTLPVTTIMIPVHPLWAAPDPAAAAASVSARRARHRSARRCRARRGRTSHRHCAAGSFRRRECQPANL